ncbi:MAG: transposase [Serratia marcescens]|nr:transposase [Serratia marcescens]EJC6395479.1 transposase [Serratia marcescens]MDU7468969.1 transposase [Serratia marcescens]
MENIADWRTESRTAYSNDFKLRIVELASHPDANVAKIARENGVAHNLIFKWLRMWQNEGRENDPQVPRQLRQYYRQ